MAPTLGWGAAVLAFDIGGTDVKSGILDGSGVLHDIRRDRTARDGEHPAEDLAKQLADLAGELRRAHPELEPVAAGVSVPGIVDDSAGVGIFASNLGWRNAPLRALTQDAIGLPVAFGHDVRAAGLAEYELGVGRDFANVVVLTIGTGIAGALFLDHHKYIGGGFAGEFGHMLVEPSGALCACGGVGCLETVASARAIAHRYSMLSGTTVSDARDVLAARRNGDPHAEAVWHSAIDALAKSLQRAIALIAPDAIVLGGGLAEAGDDLFGPLRNRLDGLLSFHSRPALVKAQLGDNAGLIGTAIAARKLANQKNTEDFTI